MPINELASLQLYSFSPKIHNTIYSMLASTFQDSKEYVITLVSRLYRPHAKTSKYRYKARALQPYNPYPASIKQIRDVIPKSLLARNTLIGTSWVIRDFILAWLLYECATRIDSFAGALNHLHISLLLRCVLWPLYWLLQSFCWCGIWILGGIFCHLTDSPANILFPQAMRYPELSTHLTVTET